MNENAHDDTQTGTGEASRSAEEIRADIEETREQLGETVEALAEKTDVKTQARHRVESAKETVAQNLGVARGKADEFASKAKEATPESAGAGVQQVTSTVQRQPLPFAVAGAFLAGLAVGRLLGKG